MQNSISWRGFILTRPEGFTEDDNVFMYTDEHVRITIEEINSKFGALIEVGDLKVEVDNKNSFEESLEAARNEIKETMMDTFDMVFDFLNR